MVGGKAESGLHGRGHYHERYRKDDGRWRISHSKVTRLRIEGFGPWWEMMMSRVVTPA